MKMLYLSMLDQLDVDDNTFILRDHADDNMFDDYLSILEYCSHLYSICEEGYDTKILKSHFTLTIQKERKKG